jgi:hypothetical protein
MVGFIFQTVDFVAVRSTAPFSSSNETPRASSSVCRTIRPASSAAAGGGSLILYITSRMAAAFVKSRTSSSEEASL